MSLNSFIEAKKQGALTILHSSWMHPYKQKEILHKEYSTLGIKSKPIASSRIKTQLSEIEIVDKIWCISRLVFESYIQNRVNPSKLFYLPLGVNLKDFIFEQSSEDIYSLREKVFTILFVGTVNFEKGAHLLLEAISISKINSIKVIFNGAVAFEIKSIFDEYKKLLNKKNIEVIVNPGNPTENYKCSSIFVLPSVHESFGLVVLEAMASGLPVIMSDGVGAKDCAINNKTGFIFQSHNVEQLKNKIEYFYFNRSEIRIKGNNAAIHAQNYSWANIALKFKREYTFK